MATRFYGSRLNLLQQLQIINWLMETLKGKNRRPDMMRKSRTARKSELKSRPRSLKKPGAERTALPSSPTAAVFRPERAHWPSSCLLTHPGLVLPQ